MKFAVAVILICVISSLVESDPIVGMNVLKWTWTEECGVPISFFLVFKSRYAPMERKTNGGENLSNQVLKTTFLGHKRAVKGLADKPRELQTLMLWFQDIGITLLAPSPLSSHRIAILIKELRLVQVFFLSWIYWVSFPCICINK